MQFEARLKEYARMIGIDLLGITTAEPFTEAYKRLALLEEKGYLSPWAEKDLKKRCHPKLLMDDAKSIIAIGVCYGDVFGQSSWVAGEGRLALFAQHEDYHTVLRKKLEELLWFIKEEYPAVKSEIYVDTGPLIDREVAYRAGLGFIGKNSALINPEYGSFIALGEILLNISLKADIPLENGCGECTRCIQACPQKVIKAPGEIRTEQCLAHYTQEKGFLDKNIRKKLGTRVWGCDTCQDVCPYNHNIKHSFGSLNLNSLGYRLDFKQLLALTKTEFCQLIGPTPMGWRGRTTLQRNVLIVLGNQKKTESVPVLKEALHDERPIIRATAAWALGQINDLVSRKILEDALKVERIPEVIAEITWGLQQR